MACAAACFNCPFSRSADQGAPNDEEPHTFYVRHMVDYQPYICPEQDDVCFGQLTMLANQCVENMIPDRQMSFDVGMMTIDRIRFFEQNNEFIRYHREGFIFGSKWLIEHKERIRRGPIVKPRQGELF